MVGRCPVMEEDEVSKKGFTQKGFSTSTKQG
jgi:hypothetical protein